jgi:hypothetical protein
MDLHLKPCPHCASEAKLNVINDDPDGPNYQGNYIACEACGASTQLMFSTGEDCRPVLAELWNARHQMEQALAAERERCSADTDKLQQVWEETRQQRDDLLAHIAGKGPLPAWADAWLKA